MSHMQGCFSRSIIVKLAPASGETDVAKLKRKRNVEGGVKVVVQYPFDAIDTTYQLKVREKLGDVVPWIEQVADAELAASPVDYPAKDENDPPERLHISAYCMDMRPGSMMRRRNVANLDEVTNCAASLATVLARGQVADNSSAAVQETILPYLRWLLSATGNLEIQSLIEQAIQEAPRLKTLPLWISHYDLNELNVLVNPNRGNGTVTGIIDWEYAVDLPFGCGLHRVIDTIVIANQRDVATMRRSWRIGEKAYWDSLLENISPELRERIAQDPELLHIALRAVYLMCAVPVMFSTPEQVQWARAMLSYKIPWLRDEGEAPIDIRLFPDLDLEK